MFQDHTEDQTQVSSSKLEGNSLGVQVYLHIVSSRSLCAHMCSNKIVTHLCGTQRAESWLKTWRSCVTPLPPPRNQNLRDNPSRNAKFLRHSPSFVVSCCPGNTLNGSSLSLMTQRLAVQYIEPWYLLTHGSSPTVNLSQEPFNESSRSLPRAQH